MKKVKIIYHGSQQIVEKPMYGVGKQYNDYGQGFYCTESQELAKEWGCPVKHHGYANQYVLDMSELRVLHLTDEYHILNWLAVLLQNRSFDINSSVGKSGKEYILDKFLPDLSSVDVVVGYRADDSYFSFAEDFVNNMISLHDLETAMKLGTLGEQVVLISEKAFSKIKFLDYEIADYKEYYYKRHKRDAEAREAYQNQKKDLKLLEDDVFLLDIIRKEMTDYDIRL